MRQTVAIVASALALSMPAMPARASGGGGGGAMNFVTLEEISVPIVEGARADGRLRLKLVLEAQDAAAAERLLAALPLLRATSLSAALEFARLYASPMTPVDVGRLSSDLTAALKKQDAGIARVLIVEVAAARA
jgi:hypothetical protein